MSEIDLRIQLAECRDLARTQHETIADLRQQLAESSVLAETLAAEAQQLRAVIRASDQEDTCRP